MLQNFVFDAAITAMLVAGWYFWIRRLNHRRSVQIATWIEAALAGHGTVSAVCWRSASRFNLDLRVWNSSFRRAWFAIELQPRQMPLNWLLSRLKGRTELATFHAELDCPPALNLHVSNQRWCGHTRRKKPVSLQDWSFESLGPVMVTTREDWQDSPVLEALLAARASDFSRVSFQKRTPHLTLSAPIELYRPGRAPSNLFESIQELASRASAHQL